MLTHLFTHWGSWPAYSHAGAGLGLHAAARTAEIIQASLNVT